MNPPLDAAPAQARLRSGTAARLAGVPVATLRVWERRYGVVAAPRSAAGQRLYSPQDVQRLRLMRQLTESGHAIGTLAGLQHTQLLELLAAVQESPSPAAGADRAPPVRQLLLVGHGLRAKLQAVPACQVLPVPDGLPAALAQAATAQGAAQPVDALVLHLPSLQPEDLPLVARLRSHWPAAPTLLVYAFGAEALAEALRARGVTVQREPVTGRDLARLLAPAPGSAADHGAGPLGAVLPRRYSDAALAALAEMPSSVICECPRHLAEIVTQLAGFEHYGAQCLARNPGDAALHRRLVALAGAARTQFEQALADVVAAEGLALPEGP